MATVDIIIPSFNAAHYLPFAIESVMAQTYEDWRIILIDDGSTDNTKEMLSSFMRRLGPKLTYIKKANGGLPAARNTAICNSTAEFLALLDADDVWLPFRLEESLKAFRDNPDVGLAYGYVSRIDANGALGTTHDQKKKHDRGRIAPYIYMRAIDLPCPTVTFRRRCVDEVGLFDERLRATEDRDLWFRIASRYDVALVPKVIAYYRSSPQAMTTDPDRMLKAQLQFLEKHFGTAGCGKRERRVARSRVYRQRAEALEKQGRPWPAFAGAMRAITLNLFSWDNARTATSLFFRALGNQFR